MSHIILNYKAKLELGFGELGAIIRWCQQNCIGEWAYSVVDSAGESRGEYVFYFDDEFDYVNFYIFNL